MDTGHEDERQKGKTGFFPFFLSSATRVQKKCVTNKYWFASVTSNFQLF